MQLSLCNLRAELLRLFIHHTCLSIFHVQPLAVFCLNVIACWCRVVFSDLQFQICRCLWKTTYGNYLQMILWQVFMLPVHLWKAFKINFVFWYPATGTINGCMMQIPYRPFLGLQVSIRFFGCSAGSPISPVPITLIYSSGPSIAFTWRRLNSANVFCVLGGWLYKWLSYIMNYFLN